MVAIDEEGLKHLLHSISVFLTEGSVHRIFSVVDRNRNGYLKWEELHAIVFPEHQKKKVKFNKSATATAKKKRMSINYEHIDENALHKETDIKLENISLPLFHISNEDNHYRVSGIDESEKEVDYDNSSDSNSDNDEDDDMN